jgi:hypothetical protein
MIFRGLVSSITVILFSLFVVPVASAHNAVPRVEISLERLHPGEVVDVRGVSFGMDDPVSLSIIGTGVDISLGEILADAEGEFLHISVLPTDLAEGTYYFRAVTSHHFVLSPPLTVWGTAIIESHEQGPRDEDDGLLAPMPTFPPAVATAPVPVMPNEAATTARSQNWLVVSFAALIIISLSILFAIRKKNQS